MSGHEKIDGRYWPRRIARNVTMTPAQAWRAWLLGEIDAAEFGRVLNAWEKASS